MFPRPQPAAAWKGAVPLPGATANEPCVLIKADLWAAFHELSLWIEALCIHEWSLFIERANASETDRGRAYSLLTSRPDNRRKKGSSEGRPEGVLKISIQASTRVGTGSLPVQQQRFLRGINLAGSQPLPVVRDQVGGRPRTL